MQSPKLTMITSILLAGAGVIILILQMTQPFFAIFLVKNSSLTSSQIGLLIGITSIAGTLSGFIGGQLSDIVGHAKLMVISISFTSYLLILLYLTSVMNPSWLIILTLLLLMTYFSMKVVFNRSLMTIKAIDSKMALLIITLILILLFYPILTFHLKALTVLFYVFLNLLLQIFATLFHPPSQGIISQFLPDEQHNIYFQLRYTVATVAYSLGPFIVAVFGITATASSFLYAGVISLFYLFILLFALQKISTSWTEKIMPELSFKAIIKSMYEDKRLVYLILSGTIFFFGQALFMAPLSLYLVHTFKNGLTLFTLLLIINPVIVFISQPIIIWLSKGVATIHILIVGSILNAIAFLILGIFMNQIIVIFAAWIISSVGETMIYPFTSNLIDEMAPLSLRGSYFGVYTLAMLGLAIGPVIGCAMFQANALNILFVLTAVFTLLTCFAYKKIIP